MEHIAERVRRQMAEGRETRVEQTIPNIQTILFCLLEWADVTVHVCGREATEYHRFDLQLLGDVTRWLNNPKSLF